MLDGYPPEHRSRTVDTRDCDLQALKRCGSVIIKFYFDLIDAAETHRQLITDWLNNPIFP